MKKVVFAVIVGLGVGAAGMNYYRDYQEQKSFAELQASYDKADEATKEFMRCIGLNMP